MVYLNADKRKLKLEFFIARRVQSSTAYKNSVSAPIIKIAIAAIAIGIVVMLIAIATGVGLQNKIKDKISAFNGHIAIQRFDRNNSITTVDPIIATPDYLNKLSRTPGVVHVQAVATKGGIIRTATSFEGIIFKGVGTDFNKRAFQDFMVAGQLPELDGGKPSKEVIISDDIARKLELEVGDKAPTYFMQGANRDPIPRGFVISGIYNSGLAEYDSRFIIGDLRHVQRINKWEDEIGRFEVFIEDFDAMDQIASDINSMTPPMVYASSIKMQYASIFEWLSLLDVNIYIIITVILIVGIINMITALLVLILERTHMVGVLRALGAQNWLVRKVFLINAMHLVVRGMLIGNAIGLGLIAIQYFFSPLRLDPDSYYVSVAPVHIEFWHVAALNIGTFIVCTLSLILPTYLVSSISPVKAMRFQ